MLCCRIWPAKVMIDVKINCAQSTCKKDKLMKRIKCFLLSYSTSWTACFIGQNFQFSIKTKLESVASVDSPYNFRLYMEAKRRRRWKFNLDILYFQVVKNNKSTVIFQNCLSQCKIYKILFNPDKQFWKHFAVRFLIQEILLSLVINIFLLLTLKCFVSCLQTELLNF